MPVWVLALITLALLGLILLAVRFRREGAPKMPEISAERLRAANPTKGRDASNISVLGRAVLARIVKADGEPVPQDTVKRSLGATNLGLQAVVDELVALDLIAPLASVSCDCPAPVLRTRVMRQLRLPVRCGPAYMRPPRTMTVSDPPIASRVTDAIEDSSPATV